MSGSMTPRKATRAMCLRCTADDFGAVRDCPETGCPIYPYRKGKGRPSVKTIRQFCLTVCWSGSKREVRECNGDSARCPLWSYRMGKNPNRSGQGTKTNLNPEVSGKKAV